MKILKKILLIIAFLVAIPLIIALFTKSEYTVEREITINRPNDQVFDYIKHLKNQENYSKWVMMDPGMKREFKGTDGTAGFIYTWDSKKDDVGKGEQKIVRIKDGERIDSELHF